MKFDSVSVFRGVRAPTEDELAFLPAALEIVERPTPPLANAIGATIIGLFCLALLWASFGHVDIVATATGNIIPSVRTKVIQPFETGVVRAIHVHDGQEVKAGDVLIELDSTMNAAESAHLRADLISAELDVARLTAALAETGDPTQNFHPPADAPSALVATQQQFLIQQVAEHRARLGALDGQRQQKAAELATINATVGKLSAVLPVLQQRVDIRQTLYDHATGSKLRQAISKYSSLSWRPNRICKCSRASRMRPKRHSVRSPSNRRRRLPNINGRYWLISWKHNARHPA